MDADMRGLLQRGVTALEKIAEEPVIHMETAPPVCPHCERINPTVRVNESEATGAMSEIVYQFQCVHCSRVFYGIPIQWSTVEDLQQVQMILDERADIGG